ALRPAATPPEPPRSRAPRLRAHHGGPRRRRGRRRGRVRRSEDRVVGVHLRRAGRQRRVLPAGLSPLPVGRWL
ncbi:MAG: hypothetical protein AVDCRST_MAG20-1477, partial [uncultured Acidimicrobiales bacterium]